MSTPLRGFILQASYRIQTEPGGSRVPVIFIYGKLEDGRTFLVRETRQRPHFYILTRDAERARPLGAIAATVSKVNFSGAPVSRVETPVPGDVPALRDRLHANDIDTFEGDVRFALRHLMERGIKGGCEIHDAIPAVDDPASDGIDLVFENPTLCPAQVQIQPIVLSFDIETDPNGQRLLAISMYTQREKDVFDEVLIVDSSDRPMPEHATRCVDEYAALDAFCDRIRTLDPDVITGWNTIDFDLTVLQRIAERLNHPLQLGRDQGALRIRKAEGYFGSGQASIPGRLALDGIDLLRGAFIRMDEYSLDAVSREVLGEGKAVAGDVRDRIGEIMHNYRHDLPAFAWYARTDARLAYQIVERRNLIPLAFARSELTGMTPDRVAASIASFDFLYLSELARQGIVAPTVRSDDARVHVAQQGGHVLEPITGLHPNVWVFDFKSLYPSIIRTFNIDPVSYVSEPDPSAHLIRTPGGAFRREPAILPRILDELFPRRESAKRAGDDVASNAIKILMNSFYGVLGTPACRFFNPALANSITSTGRELLLWSKEWFEARGLRVLYGDTDSLFVASGIGDAKDALADGRALAIELNRELALYIEQRWQVTSKLELKFEKLYEKLFLPQARHSTRGASKRYAGLIHGTDAVQFVGMEVVRRDWTALAKQIQRELYQRLFNGEPVDHYLYDTVKQLRAGKLDDALVYRKNLRKGAEDYTATTPPHVAAARKANQTSGLIAYVMTIAGAEPLEHVEHTLDREHYVQKQIRPVAEPVLGALGLSFEQVIGDQRQLDLLG